jgi:antitoxin (DNA-binding transcriptional repressor) of toxin-antitoxin stability system
MKRVNIADAKAHLSEYLREVKRGETLVICERNVPVAELRAVGAGDQYPDRPFGLFQSDLRWAKDCFAPMTDEEVDEWENNPNDPLNRGLIGFE